MGDRPLVGDTGVAAQPDDVLAVGDVGQPHGDIGLRGEHLVVAPLGLRLGAFAAALDPLGQVVHIGLNGRQHGVAAAHLHNIKTKYQKVKGVRSCYGFSFMRCF